MTNREWLLNTNEYDILLYIQNCLEYKEQNCILECLDKKDYNTVCKKFKCKCKDCIQHWLNSERL